MIVVLVLAPEIDEKKVDLPKKKIKKNDSENPELSGLLGIILKVLESSKTLLSGKTGISGYRVKDNTEFYL